MGFRIAGGKFYDPLTTASRVSGSTTIQARAAATQLRYTLAAAGQLALSASSYQGNENTVLSFSVSRSQGASGTIAVDWAITGLTEGAPSPATGTLTWNNAEAGAKTVDVQLGLVTANRTGTLALSNPRSLSGGATPTLAAPTSASLTILNIANLGPVWQTVPNSAASAGAFNKNVGQHASDPEGDPLIISISPSSPTTVAQLAAAGLSISPAGIITGNYNGVTPLTLICRASENTAQADWINRSTGPGVVWAHKFDDPASVDRFIIASNIALAQQTTRRIANDGIMGDGCLELNTPAGGTQFGSWGRPMRPIPGDINNAGLPLGPTISNATQANSQFINMRGGFFGHASYGAAQPSEFIGTDYYLQFRVKYHPNRFNANEPSGKMLMLVTGFNTPAQEIVLKCMTDYGGRWFNMYTSVGTNFNSQLQNPQMGGNGSNLQPGGAFHNSCIMGTQPDGTDACFLWPVNEWVTVLVHVIPGRQFVSTTLSDPANPRETGIRVFIARAGATSYTKIWEKLDYVWFYGVPYLDGTPQPFGWNWLNFTAFNGGSSQTPSVNGYYHRHDQMIFSTQFIPCPQV